MKKSEKEALNKKYQKKTIGEIEELADKKLKNTLTSREQFVELIDYVRMNERWVENSIYKDSTFEEYLMGRFQITKGSFMLERKSFVKFPDATKKYGVGIVTKIIKDCGNVDAGMVIDSIEAEDKKLKNGITHAKIIQFINKKKKKKPAPKKSIRLPYAELEAENANHMKKIRELEKEINDKDIQIQSLKDTLLMFKPKAA